MTTDIMSILYPDCAAAVVLDAAHEETDTQRDRQRDRHRVNQADMF